MGLQLPKNLLAWRLIDDDLTESTWNELRPLVKYHGYELWEATYTLSSHKVPDELPAPGTCFLGANKVRNFCLVHLKCFLATNGMMHAARGAGNNDYILRVIKVNGEGARHLRILRRLSCSPDRLLASNHILPMVKEIHSQDIVIGVFPRTTYDLGDLLSRRRRNSVEDILHMVIQALEVCLQAFLIPATYLLLLAGSGLYPREYHRSPGMFTMLSPRICLIESQLFH
jgi:hypothetical protein